MSTIPVQLGLFLWGALVQADLPEAAPEEPAAAAPSAEAGLPPVPEGQALPPAAEPPPQDAVEEAPPPQPPRRSKDRPAPREAAPEPVEGRGSWLRPAVGVGLGSVLGLVPWVPVCLLCCCSTGMMGAVYPMSGGDPGVPGVVCDGGWPLMCSTGLFIGMTGWVLGELAAVLGGGVAAGGLLVGGALGLGHRASAWRNLVALLGGSLAALVTIPASAVLVLLSGALPWLVALGWAYWVGQTGSGGSAVYAEWFFFNLFFMGSVVFGLGLVALAGVAPVLAGLLGWAVVGRLMPEREKSDG